jgi:hypothetical protein
MKRKRNTQCDFFKTGEDLSALIRCRKPTRPREKTQKHAKEEERRRRGGLANKEARARVYIARRASGGYMRAETTSRKIYSKR